MQPKVGCYVLERGFVYISSIEVSLENSQFPGPDYGFGFYLSRKCPKM